MNISWEVDDGYAGGSRPHSFYIDDEEIMDCDSEDEAIKLIEECIQEEFNQNISWYLSDSVNLEDSIRDLLSK